MIYFLFAVSALGQVEPRAKLELAGEAAEIKFGGALTLVHNSPADELVCSGKIRASDVVIDGTTTTVADVIRRMTTLETEVAAVKQHLGLVPSPPSPPPSPSLPPSPPNLSLDTYYDRLSSDWLSQSTSSFSWSVPAGPRL